MFITDKYNLSCEYYGLVIKYIKSHHPNWCIKVITHLKAALLVGHIFFCNQTWLGQLVMFSLTFTWKKNFTALFYGWASTVSRLLFMTWFPGLLGTQRMKGWVELGTTQWFWTRDPWIGNAAPQPLGHCLCRLSHLLFIYEQILFNFSNVHLQQQIHFLHNPFFIQPAIGKATPLFEQLSKT